MNLSLRIACAVAFWAAALAGAGAQQPSPPPSTATAPTTAERPPRPWPKEVVILQGAADAAEFWKKLDSPDWIVSRPTAGRAETEGGGVAPSPIVDAVHVKGTVEGEDARIELTIDCTLVAEGPVWVPLRIDVPTILSAREGDREVRLQRGNDGAPWEAWLEGAGSHRLRIRATVPIRVGAERRTLDLAIPEAPATSFDLVLPRRSFDFDLGPGEPPIAPTDAGKDEGVRVAAHVRPRSSLVLSWNEEVGGPRAAPLLSAQIEMAVDVDSEGVVVRSSWAISCARGVARSLRIRLDEDETVTRLQLNDQFPDPGVDHAGGGDLLTIPLTEPMRPGESRRLVLETRRPFTGGKVLELSGYPLTDAGDQTGFLGATHGPNLFVDVVKSQGMRRIDPRDLPTALKARPGTTLAMQFLEQPFALSLGVEESPPLYLADVSARLFLEPDGVRNETTLDVRWVRGSLFEIDVAVPPGLKVVSVGPPDLVEAATPPQPIIETAAERILKVRLTPQARDSRRFTLKLTGRQAAAPRGDVRLGLFAPRGAVAANAGYDVFAGRETALEPIDEAFVRDGSTAPPAAAADSAGAPSLRLRSGRNPTTLGLRLERRAREVRRETSLAARVTKRGVELRQETVLRVRHGVVSAVEVVVPAGVSSRWEVSDGQKPIRTEDLDGSPDGPRRSRLLLDRPIVDSATLTFQFRLPLARPLDDSSPTDLKIPWLTVEPGSPGPCLVDLATDPDVELVVADPAWATPESSPSGKTYHLERDDVDDGLSASARLVEAVTLPPVVVPRAFIRSSLDTDGDLRVRAWYAVESHPATLTVELPDGARWLRARVDGRAVDRIDARGDGGSISRIDLPPDAGGRPVLLDLEYHAPAASVGRSWTPPALLDGAEVLQTYWLAEVPSALVVAGPAQGWADENRWAWDFYAWGRRPITGAARLAAWAAGPSPPPGSLDDVIDGDDAVGGALFSRAGPPTPLNPWVVSRFWSVIVGASLALLVVASMVTVPWAASWIVAGGAAAALAAVLLLPPAAPALALQTAAFGLAMGGIALRLRPRESRESSTSTSTSASGAVVVSDSSRRSSTGVGSDESTAIRVRMPSTTDHRSLSITPALDSDVSAGSHRESGMRTE